MTFFNDWIKQIIISVIITTILLMIVPQNKNKKYIKVVIGIYLLMVIIMPIISKIDKKKNINSLNSLFDINKINTNQYLALSCNSDFKYNENDNTDINEIYNKYTSKNIENLYEESLEKNILQKLNQDENIKSNNKYKIVNLKAIIDNETKNVKQVYVYVNKLNNNIENYNKTQDVSQSKENKTKINDIKVNKIENVDKEKVNNSNNCNMQVNSNNDLNIDNSYIDSIKNIIHLEANIEKDNIFVKGE